MREGLGSGRERVLEEIEHACGTLEVRSAGQRRRRALTRANIGGETHSRTSEREVGRSCLTSTRTIRKEESGPSCLASMKPDGAYLYAEDTNRASILRDEGELRRVEKKRTRVLYCWQLAMGARRRARGNEGKELTG